MNIPVLGYENIQVIPFELQELIELKITRKINEHTRLTFTGIVPETKRDSYIEAADRKTEIEVRLKDVTVKNPTLFIGQVASIKIKTVRDVFFLEVEAVSATYELDVKRKSRSFQNTAMTYTDLVKQVIADYQGADVQDTASGGAKLGSFIMQYQETDWEFLKRMASRFHTGLLPAAMFNKPKFYFGIPEGEAKAELDNFHYNVRKNLQKYKTLAETNPKVREEDFTYYEVETDAVLELGDMVKFQQKPLYVYQAVSLMKEGLLKHHYLLAPRGGLSQPVLFNQGLVGASVQGKVIEVARDNVRVHLEVDPEQKQAEAYWFPYSSVYTAEGHSGWYCMPELGDYVRIYFPDYQDENAVAVSSVRKDTSEGKTNKVSNPDIKYLRTKSGKELMLAPGEIVITGKDKEVYIRLNDQDGIEIFSKQGIKFVSQKDVIIESQQKVCVVAQEEIFMQCKDSNIKMDGNTSIKGYEIKSN